MARIITKELALKILAKLNAVMVRAGKAHDDYSVEHEGVVVAITSLRRGSGKDLGHDHMPRDLHIGPSKAKLLGQCPLSRDEYIDLLRAKGLVQDV
jgi:hypothetical protein